jgi:hypothetical protein
MLGQVGKLEEYRSPKETLGYDAKLNKYIGGSITGLVKPSKLTHTITFITCI